jgi:hypothetical protein
MILSVLALFAAAGFGLSQTTYEDPQGRFVIDAPQGWQLAPQTDEKVFVFQGDGMSIIIEYVPGTSDTGELMKKADTTLRASGLTNPVLDGQLLDMGVNGHPARWGAYKSGKLLTSFVGAVSLGENGLYFLSIMAQSAAAKWKDRLEKSFQSIRMPGEVATAAADVKNAVVSAPAATGSPTPWKSDLVALTLPPGWVEKPKPRGFEKEVKGWFMSDNLPGATLMVVCYKGMGMSVAKAFDAGIKSVTIPMPGLKPVEAEELSLENGKASFAVYRGMAAGGGTEVELVSVIISKKADKSFTNLILTGLATHIGDLKAQALEIARSAR